MWPNFKKTLQKHPIPFPQKQAKGKYMYISFIDYFIYFLFKHISIKISSTAYTIFAASFLPCKGDILIEF